MTEEQLEQKCFEAYEKQCKKCFRSEPSYNDGYYDGYHECQKEHEWHDINDIEPSKEQLGNQLLIKTESIFSNTDYTYYVYKYNGESITDVAGVLAWKEIQ